MLELTDEQATRNRTALTFEQEIALEALRSALIDKSAEAFTRTCGTPITTPKHLTKQAENAPRCTKCAAKEACDCD